ncbi:hypothetical protein Mpop_3688 [Methylorubrum populi BJ001]|jgi:alkanesulfonate monooxygenase SsuD/methylene tetrahydromethanopterin reductase-like flavin-dependent oxidoreductase (luciferase family)|uniref:Uncharacterized protein n=1 Tax=Methylorubrum populi (strain ATCC BAA-705 / NCIMB 13946 / BJ001) TaxID=441620 RepID=B1Z7N0_METPB|nr:hypothetical protein Mpop_3688 [Methylorubrum populi BJ001]MBB5765831.1 alkanesulfonate monooxygenase SsuD/methylene tetrahydromethanopterin reductase-like flavin-dependent oxidoreductase (luciferase family) [Methylorubrum rhodesianum]
MDAYRSTDGLLAHISRDLGIDLGLLPPDKPVDELDIQGVQGLVHFFEEANPGKRATVADIGNAYAYNTRIVGTPESIADDLARWQEAGPAQNHLVRPHGHRHSLRVTCANLGIRLARKEGIEVVRCLAILGERAADHLRAVCD